MHYQKWLKCEWSPMTLKKAKQFSDRGSIKDLARSDESLKMESEFIPAELRIKKLYEYAVLNKDKNLESNLGFITTEYISDKNAMPLSIYSIRKIVDDIKAVSGSKIDKFSEELSAYFTNDMSVEAKEYFNNKIIVKVASHKKYCRRPSFWRASKI